MLTTRYIKSLVLKSTIISLSSRYIKMIYLMSNSFYKEWIVLNIIGRCSTVLRYLIKIMRYICTCGSIKNLLKNAFVLH